MTYLTTHSGNRIDFVEVLQGKMQPFDLSDIAYALAREPRFASFTTETFNVAAHSIRVYREVAALTKDVKIQRAALMHDASEAYLKDIPKGLKDMLPDYRYLEERLTLLLAARFNYDFPLHDFIHAADENVFAHEWNVGRTDPCPVKAHALLDDWYWEKNPAADAATFLRIARIIGIS